MKKLFCVAWALLLSLSSIPALSQVTSTTARRIVRFTGAPSNPVEGDVYYNLTTHIAYFYNGTTFVSMSGGGGGGTPGGASGTIQLNNAGAFGGITSSSVSGADTTFGGTVTIPAGA